MFLSISGYSHQLSRRIRINIRTFQAHRKGQQPQEDGQIPTSLKTLMPYNYRIYKITLSQKIKLHVQAISPNFTRFSDQFST